jgi:ribonuclease BN (tRNA processing enzyme)
VLPAIEFVELADRVAVGNGAATIKNHPLNHPGGSLGFRIEIESKTIVYITDTTVDGTYTEFLRDADLLVHECNFPDSMLEWCAKTGHSHTSQVATLAKEAHVKKLYLTHIDPELSNDDPIGLATAQAIFPETYLAEDLMEIEI